VADDPKQDRDLADLIRKSDELAHQSHELTKQTLTTDRIKELIKNSDELMRNCERILGLLHSNR
jgi:hypothetical protein